MLRYQGDPENDSTVALVGKGITFDTGGYDIKDDESMSTMKSDMGGAAAVIGAVLAIARAGIKANVTAVVAACENRVSGNAYLPGDVRAHVGKTVEVINTDAEGRLTLIDAVTMRSRRKMPSQSSTSPPSPADRWFRWATGMLPSSATARCSLR